MDRHAINRGNHDVLFPIQNGTHGGADCNACHGKFDTFTLFSCIGCHEHSASIAGAFHSGVSGYRYDDTSCFECHPTGVGED